MVLLIVCQDSGSVSLAARVTGFQPTGVCGFEGLWVGQGGLSYTPSPPPPSPTGQCLWRVGWRILPLLGSPHIGVLQSLILVYWRPAFCLSYYAPNSGDQVCSFINIEDQFCSQYLGPVLLLIARGPTVVLWLLQSGVGGKQVIGEWQQELSSHQHAKWHITQNLPNTQNNVSHKMKWHKTQSLPNTQTNVAYNENDTKHKLQRLHHNTDVFRSVIKLYI